MFYSLPYVFLYSVFPPPLSIPQGVSPPSLQMKRASGRSSISFPSLCVEGSPSLGLHVSKRIAVRCLSAAFPPPSLPPFVTLYPHPLDDSPVLLAGPWAQFSVGFHLEQLDLFSAPAGVLSGMDYLAESCRQAQLFFGPAVPTSPFGFSSLSFFFFFFAVS